MLLFQDTSQIFGLRSNIISVLAKSYLYVIYFEILKGPKIVLISHLY